MVLLTSVLGHFEQLVVSAFASNVVITTWSQAEHLVSTTAGTGTLAGQTSGWESVSGFVAGFPRTLGILYGSSVFHLVGCRERSPLSLLPLVSVLNGMGMCFVPVQCLAQRDPHLTFDL